MIGRRLLHYEITEKLGEGGMGVVYKARDTHLDRFVALKLLLPQRVVDPTRKARFIQEAKAASALNHANIIHIYDISAYDGHDFIVMEYVHGETLERLIPRKGMCVREALKLAVQVADALAAAHAAGIVHRDLKPANIMVDSQGQVKILDFGLAKLSEPNISKDDRTATIPVETQEGTIAGTAAYMSPEQAQGKAVDARSDIFSFGAVLYEMVTGHRAFPGDSLATTLAAVLAKEPKPPTEVVEGFPRDLERIILRCVRKEAARRFQVVDDLKVELADLQTESESRSPAIEKMPHQTRWRVLIAASIISLFAIAGWLALRQVSAPHPPPTVAHLTAYAGSEMYPSFSPDGNQVVFSWNGEKQDDFDIYVKLISGGTPLRLTTNPAQDIYPTWSPDGREIAFVRGTSLYLIAPLGGPEQKVAEFRRTAYPSISWSPDGKWLAVAEAEPQGANGIFLIPVGRGERRRLTSNTGFLDHTPAFSPNGRFLAYASCSSPSVAGAESCDVHVVGIGPDLLPTGQANRLTNHHAAIFGIAWTADSKSVVYASGQDLMNPYLWRVANSGNPKPERLELAGPQVRHPALSRAGNRLAYDRGGLDSDIWRFEPGAPPNAFIASTLVDNNPQFSPDGKRIAFASNRSGGGMEIWVCDQDGSNPVQLTDRLGRHQGTPRWSPDSRWIAFDSQGQDGHWDIYVIEAAGGQPRRLTAHPANENMPSWSRDGKWIYFRSDRSGKDEIWRTAASGGEELQVTDKGGSVAFESWDGKTLYYTKEPPITVSPLFARPLEGGPERQVLDRVALRAFFVVEEGIYYIAPADGPDGYSLLFLDCAAHRSRVLTHIAGQVYMGLTVSPDRKSLLFSMYKPINYDLLLIENFR